MFIELNIKEKDGKNFISAQLTFDYVEYAKNREGCMRIVESFFEPPIVYDEREDSEDPYGLNRFVSFTGKAREETPILMDYVL